MKTSLIFDLNLTHSINVYATQIESNSNDAIIR